MAYPILVGVWVFFFNAYKVFVTYHQLPNFQGFFTCQNISQQIVRIGNIRRIQIAGNWNHGQKIMESCFLGATPLQDQILFHVESCVMVFKRQKKHIGKFKKRWFGFTRVNIAYPPTLFCWSMWTNLTPIPSLSTSTSQDLSIDFRT